MNLQGNILLVEPDQDAAEECSVYLKSWGYKSMVTSTHLQALTLLDDITVDLALVSIEATDIDGYEFCRLLRRREKEYNREPIYLILLGKERHRNIITTKLNIDADDFIIKPYLFSELRWRIASGLKKLYRLRQAVVSYYTDFSFHILSSEEFYKELCDELNRTIRKKSIIAILLVQFTGLKLIRIDYGNEWATRLEDYLAQSIGKMLRSYDRIGRFKEGLLCVLIPDTSLEGIQGFINRIQNLLQKEFCKKHIEFFNINLELQGLYLHFDQNNINHVFGGKVVWGWIMEHVDNWKENKSSLQVGYLSTQESIVYETLINI